MGVWNFQSGTLIFFFFSSVFHVFWEISSPLFSKSSVFYLTFNFFLLYLIIIFLLLRGIFVLGLLNFLRFPSSCILYVSILQVTFSRFLAPIFVLEALLKCLVIPTFQCPIGNFMYPGGSRLLWALSRVIWLACSLGESLRSVFLVLITFWKKSIIY